MKVLILVTTMVIAMAVILSCVYIPTPEHFLISERAAISNEAIKWLEPFKTTRAEVLLLFGDPTNRYDKGRFFVYRWELIHGYLVVYPVGLAGAGSKLHYLCCEFTPGNLLSRYEHFKGGTTFNDPTERMNEWMAESPFYQRLQNPNLMK